MTGEYVAVLGDYPVREISYTVPSMSAERAGTEYTVSVDDAGWHCTCPDHIRRHRHCKHIKGIMARTIETGKPKIRVDWFHPVSPAPAAPAPMPAKIAKILSDLYGD